jgi:hypothetical protein
MAAVWAGDLSTRVLVSAIVAVLIRIYLCADAQEN